MNEAGETVNIDFVGDAAWINGGSPTAGVLGFAMKGPFTDFYQTITGFQMTEAGPTSAVWVDWIYMLLDAGDRARADPRSASSSRASGGIIWMAIFYTATAIWPEHNPFLDDHVVEALALGLLFFANAGIYLAFGKAWQRTELVQQYPILA